MVVGSEPLSRLVAEPMELGEAFNAGRPDSRLEPWLVRCFLGEMETFDGQPASNSGLPLGEILAGSSIRTATELQS